MKIYSDKVLQIPHFGRGHNQNILILSSKWLREAKIATLSGSVFGRVGEGYLRISFATGENKIKEAFERTRTALQKL
jgi:aspartate/methionine/tyrosine aminotransferase